MYRRLKTKKRRHTWGRGGVVGKYGLGGGVKGVKDRLNGGRGRRRGVVHRLFYVELGTSHL